MKTIRFKRTLSAATAAIMALSVLTGTMPGTMGKLMDSVGITASAESTLNITELNTTLKSYDTFTNDGTLTDHDGSSIEKAYEIAKATGDKQVGVVKFYPKNIEGENAPKNAPIFIKMFVDGTSSIISTPNSAKALAISAMFLQGGCSIVTGKEEGQDATTVSHIENKCDNFKVELADNCENCDSFVIPDGKNVVLDTKGHSLTFKDDTTVTVNGELSIVVNNNSDNYSSLTGKLNNPKWNTVSGNAVTPAANINGSNTYILANGSTWKAAKDLVGGLSDVTAEIVWLGGTYWRVPVKNGALYVETSANIPFSNAIAFMNCKKVTNGTTTDKEYTDYYMKLGANVEDNDVFTNVGVVEINLANKNVTLELNENTVTPSLGHTIRNLKVKGESTTDKGTLKVKATRNDEDALRLLAHGIANSTCIGNPDEASVVWFKGNVEYNLRELDNVPVELEAVVVRKVTVNGITANSGLVYDGQPKALITQGTANTGTLKYAVTDTSDAPSANTEWSENVPEKTDAGTYYVWYKVEGADPNYNDLDGYSTPKKVSNEGITISRKSTAPLALTPNSDLKYGAEGGTGLLYEYTAPANAATVKFAVTAGTDSEAPAESAENVWKTTFPTMATLKELDSNKDKGSVQAGSYKVWVKAQASDNYAFESGNGWTVSDDGTVATTSVEVNVGQAEANAAVQDGKVSVQVGEEITPDTGGQTQFTEKTEFDYTGQSIACAVQVQDKTTNSPKVLTKGGDKDYTVEYYQNTGSGWTEVGEYGIKDAGNYKAVIRFTDNANFNGSVEKAFTVRQKNTNQSKLTLEWKENGGEPKSKTLAVGDERNNVVDVAYNRNGVKISDFIVKDVDTGDTVLNPSEFEVKQDSSSVTDFDLTSGNDKKIELESKGINYNRGSVEVTFKMAAAPVTPTVTYTTETKDGITYHIEADHAEVYEGGSNITKANIASTIGGENVTIIGENAFNSCTKLTQVTIPATVKEIASNAFWGCTALTSITIPKTVTTIDKDAFSHCSALKEIVGYTGSAAQKFAEANGYKFKALDATVTTVTTETSQTTTTSTTTVTTVTESGTTAAETTTTAGTTTAATPAKPTNITIDNNGVVTWDEAENAVEYKVFKKVGDNVDHGGWVKTNSYKFNSVPAQDYEIYVAARNSDASHTSWSDHVAIRVAKPLGTATNVKVDKDGNVTWTAAKNAVKYKVVKIVNGKSYGGKEVTTTSSSIKVPTSDYQVYVAAFGENGAKTISEKISVKVDNPLGVVNDVTVDSNGKVTWAAAKNAVEYKVGKVVDGKTYYTDKVTGTTTEITPATKDYQVFVVAFDKDGKKSWGKKNLVEVGNLGTVLDPKVDANGNVSWTAARNAVKYKVGKVVNGITYYTGELTKNSATISVPKSNYKVFVVAFDKDGNKTWGTKVDVKVK